MNPLKLQQDSAALYKQRNALIIISVVLLFINALFAVSYFSRTEKIILVPPHLTKEVGVSDNVFSESYIEEMTDFFATLMLNLTADNIKYRSSVLLKHVDSGSYHVIQNHFKEEEDKYLKYNLATQFTATDMKVNAQGLVCIIRGVLVSKFADTGAQENRVAYRIEYKNSKGRLLIKSFLPIKEEDIE